MANAEKLKKASEAAVLTFAKLKMDEYADLQSKLEYCIGSYDHDKNPSGLVEIGTVALSELKAVKAKSPRKVTKKLITDLEKSL